MKALFAIAVVALLCSGAVAQDYFDEVFAAVMTGNETCPGESSTFCSDFSETCLNKFNSCKNNRTCADQTACIKDAVGCMHEFYESYTGGDKCILGVKSLYNDVTTTTYRTSTLGLRCVYYACTLFNQTGHCDTSTNPWDSVCLYPINATVAPTTTVAATTPAPTTIPVCNCNGHGFSYYNQYTKECRCYCYWPYGGTNCNECADSRYFFHNGQCIACLNPNTMRILALPGIPAKIPLNRSYPGCSIQATVEYMYYTYSPWWRTIVENIPFNPTDEFITVTPKCEMTSWSYVYLNRRTLLAYLQCKTAYTWAQQDIPTDIQMHFVDGSMMVGGHSLHFVKGLNTKTIPIYVTGHKIPAHTFSTSDLGTFVNSLNMHLDYSWSPEHSCTPPAKRDVAPTLLLMFGDVRGCTVEEKVAFNEALATIARAGTSIMWFGEDPSAPSFANSFVAPPYVSETELFDAMSNFLLRVRPVSCDGALTFFPATALEMKRSELYFDGVCGISKCCVGLMCSQFVKEYNGRSSCTLPLIPAGDGLTVTVTKNSTGDLVTAAAKLNVVRYYPTYYVWRDRRWYWDSSISSWTSELLNTMTVYRAYGWYARDVTNAERCCSIVALGWHSFQVIANVNDDVCFTYWTTMTYPTATANMFPSIPMTYGLQCYRNLIEDDYSVTGDALGIPTDSDKNLKGSIKGKSNPSGGGTAGSGSGDAKPKSREWKIDKYIKTIKNKAKEQPTGRAMNNVRVALQSAGLKATYPRAKRNCSTKEVPERDGKCYSPWGVYAKDSGPYLLSMGFEAVPTDWYLTGAERGDIVVFPSVTVVGVEYAEGHIAIKTTTDTDEWVSDFTHTKMVYEGLYEALESGDSTKFKAASTPILYRLKSTVIPEPPRAEEEIIPIEGIDTALTTAEERVAYVTEWVKHDTAKITNFDSAVAEVNRLWKCPMRISTTLWPAQLWRLWIWGAVAEHATWCFQMWGSSAQQVGVRCCYNANQEYIPSWPSRIDFTSPWNYLWSRLIDDQAEKIACYDAGKDSAACALYQSRRPAPPGTNSPFTQPTGWVPVRRSGGAFGDPHCTTYDGFKFECNFKGEALWTACGDWKVHVVAEAVGADGQATVVKRIGIKSGNDTLIGELGGERGFLVYLNDKAVMSDHTGDVLSLSFFNTTLTVKDTTGNVVSATFMKSMIGISTSPAESCRGNTTGLCGNNDDNPDNDLVRPDGVVVSPTTTAEDIYSSFVLSHLITKSDDSMFPLNAFVEAGTNFIPKFADPAMLASCPSICNNDVSCCFDYSVGGEEFATSYAASNSELVAANSKAMGYSANWPPLFDTAPATIQGNATVSAEYAASDDDNIAVLNCTVCDTEGVTCDTLGINTGTARLTVSAAANVLPEGPFKCTAVDGQGGVNFAITKVLGESILPNTNETDKPGGAVSLGIFASVVASVVAALLM